MIDINKEFIKKNKRWVALFSQTGSEIVKISRHIGKYPDLIITDNEDIESWHPMMKSLAYLKILTTISKANRKNIKVLKGLFESDQQTCITLHGWLNIVPAEICETFEIYNGHPGLITLYPELKGKDPQEMAWEGKYGTIGSVVHKCTAELDGGEIVKSVSYVNRCDNKEELYNKLKESSFIAWNFFLGGKI
jgi:folate-dependent phosphoribosylglycinamide formyltransferase PurN